MDKCKRIGVCPKCFTITALTVHHVYPKRFFGTKNNDSKLLLCRVCLDMIEIILPYYEKLDKEAYLAIHKKWLSGRSVIVTMGKKSQRFRKLPKTHLK